MAIHISRTVLGFGFMTCISIVFAGSAAMYGLPEHTDGCRVLCQFDFSVMGAVFGWLLLIGK